ncbi:NAD(P)-dependent oxidoreductase [Candidatus Berkelbacteria bacterium]|nr:NAD(P)-dependent oxidoreductase [Candidatus Berkelbacteria bacterium]
MKILVTGADGLVGSHFVDAYLKIPGSEILLTPNIKELDITNPKELSNYFSQHKPKTVIHFAAFTDVSKAEEERNNEQGLAWQVNVTGTSNIVQNCLAFGSFLIHISTDVVFAGRLEKPGPYKETDPPENNPDFLSWYGWTKRKAESQVTEKFPTYAIIRIANPVRAHFAPKLDYIRKILWLFDQKKLYPMFQDQYLTLTYINEVSKALMKILQEQKTGVFHVSSSDLFTPLELANYLLEKARGVKNQVKPASIVEYLQNSPSRARYPILGGLKTEKTQKELGVSFRGWKQIIDALIKEGLKI